MEKKGGDKSKAQQKTSLPPKEQGSDKKVTDSNTEDTKKKTETKTSTKEEPKIKPEAKVNKEKEEEKKEKEEKEEEKEEEEEEEDDGEESEEEIKPKKEIPPTYRNGSAVMAKVMGKIQKNVWFTAKVIGSRPTALGPLEYHVNFTDEAMEGTKEWIPERFVTWPLNTDHPAPADALTTGTLALGERRKPGGTVGWWYSVKVLRYLNDVPGAFVQWTDFPFPDSILEAKQVYPVKPKAPEKDTKEPQTGVKRQLSDGAESAPKKEKVV